jgi:hypothetical protein
MARELRSAEIKRGGHRRRSRAALAGLLVLAVTGLAADSALAVCTQYSPKEVHFLNGKTVKSRPFGRSVIVSGRATCEDGTPAPSGVVGMAEYLVLSNGQRLSYGGQFSTVASNGTFSFVVSPGPSRELDVAYAAPGVYTNFFPGHLEVISRIRPRLHIRPKIRQVGESSHFKGSLPGPFLSGRPVIALQARTGHKWRTFKVVPLDSAGKFKGKYRFSRTSNTTVYHFRAKPVVGGVEYPYSARASRQKRAIVSP